MLFHECVVGERVANGLAPWAFKRWQLRFAETADQSVAFAAMPKVSISVETFASLVSIALAEDMLDDNNNNQ